jgi:hypothetical protein
VLVLFGRSVRQAVRADGSRTGFGPGGQGVRAASAAWLSVDGPRTQSNTRRKPRAVLSREPMNSGE